MDKGLVTLMPEDSQDRIRFRLDGQTIKYLGGGGNSVTQEGDVFKKATKVQYDSLTYFTEPVELTPEEAFDIVKVLILEDAYPGEELIVEMQEDDDDRFVFGVWLKYPPPDVQSSLCGWFAVDKITGDIYNGVTGESYW